MASVRVSAKPERRRDYSDSELLNTCTPEISHSETVSVTLTSEVTDVLARRASADEILSPSKAACLNRGGVGPNERHSHGSRES